MIKSHEMLMVPDENKEKPLKIEVNWNPKDKRSNEAKLLRFIYPNGDEAIVRREHFQSILFALGKQEDQKDMIPYTVTSTRWYETTVGVKAMKDIKKGEMVVFPVKFHIPSVTQEVIGDIRKSREVRSDVDR